MENEKEFLEKVEKAAEKGVMRATSKGSVWRILSIIIPFFLVFGLAKYINGTMKSMINIEKFIGTNAEANTHDLVLEDNGFLGYLAADFAEPVITQAESNAKLIVYEIDLHEVTTITESGLFNWSALSKTQCITYYATAQYVVELKGISDKDIEVDNESKIVTIKVPNVKLEDIIIDESKIEIGDTVNGVLTFGEIKTTAQQNKEIIVNAKETMRKKLDNNEYQERAEKYGKLAIKDIYLPVIRSIDKSYTVEIEYR